MAPLRKRRRSWPWFEHRLPGLLAALPEIHAILERPGARLADVGCGGGWSSIALARAYPGASVVGYDIDQPSVNLARENAAAQGVAGRASFQAAGAAALDSAAFDAIFAFECIHDMADPVGTPREVRRAIKPDGVVVIMYEAVADQFAPGGDAIERSMYGFSDLEVLPTGELGFWRVYRQTL